MNIGSIGEPGKFAGARDMALSMSGTPEIVGSGTVPFTEDERKRIRQGAEEAERLVEQSRREESERLKVALQSELKMSPQKVLSTMGYLDLVVRAEWLVSKNDNLKNLQDNRIALHAAYIDAVDCLQLAVDKAAQLKNITELMAGKSLKEQVSMISERDAMLRQSDIIGTYVLVESLGEEIRKLG